MNVLIYLQMIETEEEQSKFEVICPGPSSWTSRRSES